MRAGVTTFECKSGYGLNVTLGGTVAAAANVIAGNAGNGVYATSYALIEGNFIGANSVGTAFGNGWVLPQDMSWG